MWLTSSSIGRKLVMAVTGVCLVLFVTFHVVMNAVCILWPTAYNQVCMFLGANWYALVASIGLAALFIIHIFYAVWLTLQNRKARGNDRYEVTSRPPQVEWASKNMLVLGIVILAFLVVHMIQFWAKMQLQELLGTQASICAGDECMPAPPEFGTLFIQAAFSQIWVPVVYIIGFVALWFHMNHGFWSMFHTAGWDGDTWIKRLKCIGCIWTSIVVGLFILEAVVFTVQANNKYYLEDTKLQEQYAEYWSEHAQSIMEEIQVSVNEATAGLDQAQANQAVMTFFQTQGPAYIEKLEAIQKAVEKQCPKADNQVLHMVDQIVQELKIYSDPQTMQQMQQQMQQQMPQGEMPVEIETEPAPQAATVDSINK